MINAAIIGLGWWGRYIIGSLQGQSDAIRFVRAVDINPESAPAFADENGLRFSTDFADALGDDDVDAVILTTPHSLHEGQIVQAATAGKHVFSEKPLALTKSSAARAVAACERAGVVLGIGHERRFEPALLEIKTLIDIGSLGTIQHVEANFSHDSLAGVKAGDWRTSEKESPAAAMTGMGIHLTDSFIQMLGPIAKVHALTAKRVTQWESGDLVSVQVKFKNGATGSFSSLLATPFFMRFHVFGTIGWAEARDSVRPEQVGTTILSTRLKGGEVEVLDVPSIDTVRVNIEAFAAAIEGGAPYPITMNDMVHNIAVLEAITRSAESGQPVTV
ncbi:MAG: Gfo/Idh/MocA family oxidoreductase [Proteobacteria bacterium]|nr:Gfo/Idh/MocA family oxidoreductase [Pseudomonadota bacterium]